MDEQTTRRFEELIEVLKARVEERRSQGLYPADLEGDLDEHFRRIANFRVAPSYDEVRDTLEALDAVAAFSPDRIPTESNWPGGRTAHTLLGRAVGRQSQGILQQMQAFADGVRAVLRALADALNQPNPHVHPVLLGQLDALMEQVASFDRGPTGSEAAVGNLRQRVEALEAAEARRGFRPFYDSARFESEFRGSREDLLDRYRDLAKTLIDAEPVVDVGCGRGEFLELLDAQRTECWGVELDPGLVEACRERNLKVELGDGLTVLERLDDDSLGAIVMIQVIEHLTPQQAVDIVCIGFEKLRQGGRFVVETVNPQSLYVFAHPFYVDPTHTQPVHPAYLAFLFKEAGYSGVDIDWRSPAPEHDTLIEADADDTQAENVRRLNRLLFGPQDYALVATR